MKIRNFIRSTIKYFSLSTQARIIITMCVFSILYCIIAARLIYITNHSTANERKILCDIEFDRKDIVDRNGNLLAMNVPYASLYANPQKVMYVEESVDKLRTVFHSLNKDKLLNDLHSNKSFVWIKHGIDPNDKNLINNLGLVGFYFKDELKRVYTQSNVMSHVIGYVGQDSTGLAGIEKYFNEYLLSSDNSDALKLSIDFRIQNIVSEELEKSIEKFSGTGGVGVVADVTNGEVIALVSKPDFDPHNPANATPEQLFNAASLGVYEIGSVFKIITFAIGFDNQNISLRDAYYLSNNFVISKFRVKDFHPHTGWNSIAQIFMNSSNIGTSMIALEIGRNVYWEYITRFGLTKKLSIEIPEKGTPLYPKHKLKDIDLVTMSYGYALSISPLHFLEAMVPIVNGGYAHKLTLIKKDEEVKIPNIILNEDTSAKINKLMYLTVKNGTGKKADVPGYLVGGKTGTANKVVNKKYSNNARRSSFVAVTPVINPKYIIYFMVDEPKGIKETGGFATAGYVAAPYVSNIIQKLSSLYGMKVYNEEDEHIKKTLHVDYEIRNGT